MTGMLASVTSLNEAVLVLKEGVDIIDMKNPYKGALGALETTLVSNIVNSVNGLIPTSATIGDVEPDDPDLSRYIYDMANTGVDYVKVGLFSNLPSDTFIQVINESARHNIKLIVVLFAENLSSLDLLKGLMNSNIKGLMLDTKNKSDKNLCSLINKQLLGEFIRIAKSYGLLTGLAGSLRYENIVPLLDIRPDYLGFRGALCSGHNRVQSIDPVQIKKIRKAIPQQKIINFDNDQYRTEMLNNGTVA